MFEHPKAIKKMDRKPQPLYTTIRDDVCNNAAKISALKLFRKKRPEISNTNIPSYLD